LTARVLIGLLLGFAIGFVVNATPVLAGVPRAIEPIGTLFINAIRMTVIPLVVASLIVGVAGAPEARTVGRLGGRAVAWFVGLVLLSAIIGVLIAPPAFSLVAPDRATVDAIQASAGTASDVLDRAKAVPSVAQWLTDLIPVNPIRAATESAMLPLIVFSVLFGLALGRVDAHRRSSLLRGVQGVQEASFVLVRWVLVTAPIGVFALAVPLAARLGLAAAGAVVWYIVVVSVLCVLFMALVLYPLAARGGRVSLRTFARTALPAQAVAMSSRSSLAALPVIIEQTRDRLGLPESITGFLVPLSAATFRAGAGIGITGGVCFIAMLYGVHLSAAQLATIAVTTTVLSFSVPGVPAGSIIVMVPVLLAARLPVEAVGILIGLDTIPDMFRTTTNVTGTLAVATVFGERERGQAVAR
jgi:proton glutamate symport protein